MNQSETYQEYTKLRSRIAMAADALTRAEDGCAHNNWDTLELGYAIDQLAKVQKYVADAMAIMNAATNGANEGKPTGIYPPLPPAPGDHTKRGF